MWLIALLVLGCGDPQVTVSPDEPATVRNVGETAGEAKDIGPGVPVRVHVRNEMGRRFRLVEVRVILDGTEVVHQSANGTRELERAFSALESPVMPGEHALTATLIYEGRNTGPFSYLDNYRYKVQTTYPFELDAGDQPASLHVVAHERAGANVPLEKKPILEVMTDPGSGVTPSVSVLDTAGTTIVRQ